MADTKIRALKSIMRDGERYGPGAPAGEFLTVSASEAQVLIAGGWAADAPADPEPHKETAKERKEREKEEAAKAKAEADAAAEAEAKAKAEAAAKAAAENGGA